MSVAAQPPILTLPDLAASAASAGAPPPGWPATQPWGRVRLAVLGWPIAHSISPPMQQAALAAMGLADWRYHRVAVPPEDLPTALLLLHQAGFFGLNLTVPHKVQAFGLVEGVSASARQMGAVNTLRRTATGWEARNTDGDGLALAVAEELDRPLRGARVALLGAGGAARAAAVQCLDDDCRSLLLANRDPARLAETLAALAPHPHFGRVRALTLAEVGPLAGELDLVVNATSLGLRPEDPPPVDVTDWPRDAAPAVYDMIYNPPETPLLRAARARGWRAAHGLSMLVWQGVRALVWWSGQPVPAPIMRQAAEAALAAR